MLNKRLDLEPDEKPTEAKPSMACSVKICSENLFGYCQIMPNMDKDGKCISRRVYEDRNKSR
jgi:hypothetical protein